MDYRRAMTAILYVLRTGCQWKAPPRSLGASSWGGVVAAGSPSDAGGPGLRCKVIARALGTGPRALQKGPFRCLTGSINSRATEVKESCCDGGTPVILPHQVDKSPSIDAPALSQHERLVTARLVAEKRADLIKDATETCGGGEGFEPSCGR
jgi:hypothetical protein